MLHNEDAPEAELDALWAQAAGQAQNTIAQAQAYRITAVASAEANANYLLSLLPEYQKRPEIVAQRLYLDTMERVLASADHKFVVDAAEAAENHEIRVHVNPGPARKQTSQQQAGN